MGVPEYIFRVNPVTGVLEKHVTMGKGVDWFSDGNSQPPPAQPVYTVKQLPQIPPEKIGKGVVFTGPDATDPEPDRQLQVARAAERRRRQQLADAFVNQG